MSLSKLGIHVFLIGVSISCLLPLIWMIASSLKTQDAIFTNMSLWPEVFKFSNYTEAWKGGRFGTYFLNSLFYTVTVIFFIVLFSSMAAFAFSRLDFPGKNILFYMFIGVMMIPIPGVFVAIFVILNKLSLINTRVGYILPQINAGLPFSIYLLKTFFDKIPKEMEDSAKIDGCSKWQIYWHVALPLAKSAIAVIVIFNALSTWNEFLLANLIFSDADLMPLQVGLLKFQGERVTEYPQLMAGMTMTTAFIIVTYLFMQRFIIKGITAGAVKG
ncbi:MAG: carbohydrate ABC transporter permease [Candidatus Aureabacteria bacterium]|nr:carbohydrate ABC transporter permease [Candidatus Auribacterota bacterium]